MLRSIKVEVFYIIAFGVLSLLTATSTNDNYWKKGDEKSHFSNVSVLEKYGISKNYFLNYYGVAGPLVPIIHYTFSPITKYRPNRVRLTNLLLLPGLIFILNRILFLIYQKKTLFSWSLIAIPVTFICAPYALTILPSLFFFVLSLYLVLTKTKFEFPQAILAGLLFGCSVLCRMNLLVLILPFIWLFYRKRTDYRLFSTIIFSLFSLLLPCYIISLWGNIYPPSTNTAAFSGDFYALQNIHPRKFLFSSITWFLLLFILVPEFFFRFQLSKKHYLLLFSILILNYLFSFFNFLPAQSLFFNIENIQVLHLLSNLFGSFCLVFFIFGVRFLFKNLKGKLTDEIIFSLVSSGLILLTFIKMPLYSSRYAYQLVPMLIIIGFPFVIKSLNSKRLILHLATIAIGFAVYLEYRNFIPKNQIDF